MTDLAVLILTKNEKLHVERCLEGLAQMEPRQIFVIDCFSTDGTRGIAENASVALHLNLKVIEREWPGLHAKQFNWALDNLPIEAKWVLRMDADEYLTPETIDRLKVALTDGSLDEVNGLTLELKRKFMGGEIHHGTNGIRLLRVWRFGKGRLEDRAMDEHALVEGKVVDFDGAFYDDNLNSFEWWQEKHRGYAKRGAMDALLLFNDPQRLSNPSATDRKKIKYYKLPRYFRAVAYFCIRYFLKSTLFSAEPLLHTV